MSRRAILLKHAVRIAGLPFELHDLPRPVDAIVVLGAPLRPDGSLSWTGRERVCEGAALWHAGIAPLLVFTGGSPHSAAEAPAMADEARKLGVTSDALIVEARSRTTAENAKFTAELLRPHAVRSIRVVSQPFHLRRGRRLLRQQGFAVSAMALSESVQYQRPDLALHWVAREYVAWLAHFILPGY